MTSVRLLLSPTEGGEAVDLDLLWTGRQDEPVRGRFDRLFQNGCPPDAALDLLLFAASVYAADKAILRRATPDGWTRTIELFVPQVAPGSLPNRELEQLAAFLTGDAWTIHTYPTGFGQARLGATAQQQLTSIEEVALFSGGMDSFAYLTTAPSVPTSFIAHRDRSGLSPLQRDLYNSVVSASPNVERDLLQFSFAIERKGPLAGRGDLESSTRSRSLLFYSSAIAVAAAAGARTIQVPENGFMSLNPPLVVARRGSLSTRTTHPWTLHLFNALLSDLELDVRLRTPFALMTKGEITALALGAAGIAMATSTVSCSRPRVRSRSDVHFGNCGYCFPCLVRRAGLLAAGVDDPTEYRRDPRTDAKLARNRKTGDDFRAVVARARIPFGFADLRLTGPLPPGSDVGALLGMVERSRVELAAMLESGLTDEVRAVVGW